MWRIRWLFFFSSKGSNYLQAPSARPGWLFPTEKKTPKGSKSSRNECFSFHTHTYSVLWKLGWKEKSCCPFRRNFSLRIKILRLVSPTVAGRERKVKKQIGGMSRGARFSSGGRCTQFAMKMLRKGKVTFDFVPGIWLTKLLHKLMVPIEAAIDSWAFPHNFIETNNFSYCNFYWKKIIDCFRIEAVLVQSK